MTQIYHARNLATIETLADDTKSRAKKFYDKCIAVGAQVLIYEGIRTLEQQKLNVANGKSKTLKSYHLVGQAFDFVPVDSKGNALWSAVAYKKEPYITAIKYAKATLGMTWGGDWGWDSPHMQNEYKGYGTDTFSGKSTTSTAPIKPTAPAKGYLSKGDSGSAVKELQQELKTLGYVITVDGSYGDATIKVVKQFQKDYGLVADGYAGVKTNLTLDKAIADKGKVDKPNASTIKSLGKIKVDGVTNFTYVYEKANDKSTVIQKATKNSTFNISGSITGWYEVIINNKRYYIKSKYCSKI